MKRVASLLALVLWSCSTSFGPAPMPVGAPVVANASRISWPSGLPVYDHIVIVVEENKDYEQIIANDAAPYINGVLRVQGATLAQMYAEEHNSQGNYFWLFSGSNHDVGFNDQIPSEPIAASSLGKSLISAGHSFKGYSEGLPEIGSVAPTNGLYARKHVPWISFSNIPNGTTVANSSNLRFEDFPKDFRDLPTVAIVIPNLENDMHEPIFPKDIQKSIKAGDTWLQAHLNDYYQWAKQNNSLLIVTFDENDRGTLVGGLTDPADSDLAKRNRIVTVLAGAHIKHGEYNEGKGATHVNLLRTIEAMYGLARSGAQQPLAQRAGIADDFILTDLFEP